MSSSDVGVQAFLQRYFHLSSFSVTMLMRFIEKHGAEDDKTSMAHVLEWIDELMEAEAGDSTTYAASVRKPSCVWQRGCPEIIPALTAQNFWFTHSLRDKSSGFPQLLRFIHDLEGAVDVIREECLALRGKDVFQPYQSPSWAGGDSAKQRIHTGTETGSWNVCYLQLHNVDCTVNQALCPRTMGVLGSVPRVYGHALFSSMAPHTHITTHTGPTNKKMRIQLPLVVPEGECCRLRVGPDVHVLREGECVVFDDSFQHEAWNDSDTPRLVLIFDIWHIDLTDTEVKFLQFLQNATLRAAKHYSSKLPADDKGRSDYYGMIQNADAAADDTEVFPHLLGSGPVPVRDD